MGNQQCKNTQDAITPKTDQNTKDIKKKSSHRKSTSMPEDDIIKQAKKEESKFTSKILNANEIETEKKKEKVQETKSIPKIIIKYTKEDETKCKPLISEASDSQLIALNHNKKKRSMSESNNSEIKMKTDFQSEGLFNLSLLINDGDGDIDKFKKVTTLKIPKILYNSKTDSLCAETFNNAICGKGNIMIIVMTEDSDIFGCFQKEPLPFSNEYTVKAESTDDFFLFGYNNYTNNPIYRKENCIRTIDIHPNSDKRFVFTCFSAFWVLSDGTAYIHQGFKQIYDVSPNTINPFTSKNLLSPIKLDSLLVVYWK
ncbi:hypothetical protein ENUP19_0047G0225 [Entamoeba nuttalli]|uniref:TLDc domain-containing protein n=2 Tax=Entamoeba nuttalli TaxID=412467 RepID=K2G671_ENTNP|nr:hypothetical protein ENU1_183000 [Entamoeba nuttalli P19]EKE37906.1 hypothetical protein ENU1_183000 [Entamoeba nuttalli P19]|eukprot:XP_008859790.1 hypothetical protein ENU1_183000 [Entamoeba nuttalli P19]